MDYRHRKMISWRSGYDIFEPVACKGRHAARSHGIPGKRARLWEARQVARDIARDIGPDELLNWADALADQS